MLSPRREESRVRPPAVAGLFYPQDPGELRAAVRACVDAWPAATSPRPPKALIVPHAGYPYSGIVAGRAYRLLEDVAQAVEHVVLLGPCHRVPMRGLAVPSVDAFATPLGEVPIDAEARVRLRDLGLVGIADAPHAVEHSLEVQLPFLQVVLPHFDLLPIAIGLAPTEQVEHVLEVLWNGSATLVVVSSDLSHYQTATQARRLDAQATRTILERRSELSDEQACGARAINGLLQVARRRNLDVVLLDQRNSGDTAGDQSRVVGYGSYAVFEA